MSASSSRPWWVVPVMIGVAVSFPAIVINGIERTLGAANEYATALEERAENPPNAEPAYEAPCDTGAVLAAMGMTVVEYQQSRGLTVDGVVGPQTGGAICNGLPPVAP